MKKSILTWVSGACIVLCLSIFWAFKKSPEPAGKYVAVDFDTHGGQQAEFAYSDGTKEEIKYGSKLKATEVIIQITNKLEAKGYTLDKTNASCASIGLFYYLLIFKKD